MTIYKTLPSGVNIVEYDHSLAQAVADMWNQSGDSWGGDTSIHTAADVFTEHNSSQFINVYIAEQNGKVLGYASLTKYYKDSDALYLNVLNVHPDYHGHKLGKALVLMCVERTIEMGYPRLDIHTWPGNTKSVPLYKKCGYQWEDRADSTHLVNLIPTVLATELCGDFFQKADWYDDSTRVIEIKPDGVKENGFEMFTYTWEKAFPLNGDAGGEGRDQDAGHAAVQKLAAGFERTGRRMRMLETDDFRVVLTAEHHELAFGLEYTCAFEVTNKTNAPLPVRLQGRDDGNIQFHFNAEETITGTRTFNTSFYVGATSEPQDIWRVHPCVLADVYIDGRHAEFGLGIETKFPLSLTMEERKKIAQPGAVFDCYVNITSALSQDARVTIRMPENAAITQYNLDETTVSIKARGKNSIKTTATALAYGHEALPVTYEVELDDGRTFSFTRALHVVSRGLTGCCSFETETDYIIQNGPWQLGLGKQSAYAWISPILNRPGCPGFPIGLLGKPYREEFNLMKPARLDSRREDDLMVMEAVYHSNQYPGVEYAEILTLSASGVFTRRHRVTNNGDASLSLMLKDESHVSLHLNTILPYDGGIQTIREGLAFRASKLDNDLIDENWVFEDSPRFPHGFCWPPQYKPQVLWGSVFFFEHDTGLLNPGDSFETEPVMAVLGTFSQYNDFRDFARQTYNLNAPPATPHLEWTLNSGNPFSDAEVWTAAYRSRRNERLEGSVTVSANGNAFSPDEDGVFRLPKPEGSGLWPVEMHMNMNNFDKTFTQALFAPGAGAVRTTEDGEVFIADNGVITFKVAPRFSDACFSLVKDGHEWLLSRYPSRDPFAWFNPFVGGLNTKLNNMNEALTLREPITAAFAEETDCFGCRWQGLSATVTVKDFEEHKGMSYTQYYLTRPGLPVLCYFIRVHNETGLYKHIWLHTSAFFGRDSAQELSRFAVSGTDPDGHHYRYHVGCDNIDRTLSRLMTVEAEGQPSSHDKLYLKGSHSISFGIDTRFASMDMNFPSATEHGASYTAKPMFMILTAYHLDKGMLIDLDRVVFS